MIAPYLGAVVAVGGQDEEGSEATQIHRKERVWRKEACFLGQMVIATRVVLCGNTKCRCSVESVALHDAVLVMILSQNGVPLH